MKRQKLARLALVTLLGFLLMAMGAPVERSAAAPSADAQSRATAALPSSSALFVDVQPTPQPNYIEPTPTPPLERKLELEGYVPQVISSAPPNDDFDAAKSITSFPYADTLDTTGATVAADDPNMGCGAGVNSNTVWYRLIAPFSGVVEASTAGSNYDTVLAAFTGSRGSLVRLACNDDAIGLRSRISFSVERGEVYFLEVADYGGPGGGLLNLAVNITFEGRFGERIYVRSATPITVSFWSNPYTGYYNLVGLHSPESITFGICRGSNVPPPTQIGPFPPGTELVFFLNSQASDAPPGVPPIYYNGPAERNPDNRVHANVSYDPSARTITLGWEDIWNTGDRDFDDCVMTLTGDIGIIETASTFQVLPASVPASGASVANVILLLAGEDERPLAGHRVRFISSRGNADIFSDPVGTTDVNGILVSTIRSFTPGTAILTAEDLTAGRPIPLSTSITFTPVGGELPPPPPNEGDIAITEVAGTLPLSGWYPATVDPFLANLFGDIFRNRIKVTVDWRGSIPGRVDFIINGRTHSATADAEGASYELDMSRDLHSGTNELRIVAYNAMGQRSQMLAYTPVIWEMPAWLVQLLADANATDQTQASTAKDGTRAVTTSIVGVQVETIESPKAVNIWFRIPPRNLISRVYVPVGKFETEGVQVYARLQIPLEGPSEVELRGGARYLREFERRRAAGFEHKGLSILGTTFAGDAYVFGRARFEVFILRPEAVGGGASFEVSKTWERTWLALLYLFGLPDPTPVLKALPVVGDTVANFVARIASGYFTLQGRGGGCVHLSA